MEKITGFIIHNLTPFALDPFCFVMKKKNNLLLIICALLILLPVAHSVQLTIPQTRLRILYMNTMQPVEWVQLAIGCSVQHKTRAERKEYFERARAEYEKAVREGKNGPYEEFRPGFRDWTSDDFKTEGTYGGVIFLHAEDGWITIPEVSGVRMDHYEIEFEPAGGQTLYVVDPIRYNQEIFSNNYSHILPNFDEKTFPKFAAVPEKDRVLYGSFTKQCNIPSGTLDPTYEEARFFLAAFKIIFDHWPELSAARGCGYGGDGPLYKGAYYGFLRYHCLLWMDGYTDPSLAKDITDAQRADLLQRSRELFCNDIKSKQERWRDPTIPPDDPGDPGSGLLHMDFFVNLHCECMGVKGLPPCKQSPASPPSSSSSTSTPPTQNNQPGEKGAGK